tara:strand:- start:18 stop:365 length:348 start_codon:yes stop_codon:yes gene_type:complete
MSKMVISILRMPPDLFWAGDPASRQAHESIRQLAADRIEYLEAQVEACSSRNSSDVDRIAELEAGIKGAIGLIEGNLEVTARDLLHGIAGSYDVGDDAERLKKHLGALLTQEEGG